MLADIPVVLIAGNRFTKPGAVNPAVWPNDGIVALRSALAQDIEDAILPRRRCYTFDDTHSDYVSMVAQLPPTTSLTSDPRVNGVCFTGSTETALIIRRAMAAHLAPGAALIAETGGLNAMIVDSTALPEQAVRDVVASSFQSAGQRCSALRCLYVQEDIAPHFTEMLFGAMEELALGDPWALSTDVGPVIDAEAEAGIRAHVETARKEGRLLRQLSTPRGGHFIAPTVIRVNGIGDLGREIFGPVLHLATYRAEDLAKIIADINATGYGLTFGLHTRIDNRVQEVCEALYVGNIYVNRNQIGAVVGSQPFGGEGLSGTGPKAGGPEYLARFTRPEPAPQAADSGEQIDERERGRGSFFMIASRLEGPQQFEHRRTRIRFAAFPAIRLPFRVPQPRRRVGNGKSGLLP